MSLWPVLGAAVLGKGPNRITLAPGQVYPLPVGVYAVRVGTYSSLQQLDPITGIWVKVGGGGNTQGGVLLVYSDGQNYRIANQTGAAVGALLTNGGSGYTSAPMVTPSAGGSIWKAIVGGAVSTSVTLNNGGSNYTYPPIVLISPPPALGGVQATAYCAISGGAVTSVTIDNQGAGYPYPPTITFLNDPRETANSALSDGYGAVATAALTGAQTVTAVLCVDHGQGGLTAVPTLAFSGGGGSSAAATAIMCWSITAYAVSSGGTGWTTAPLITAYDNFPGTSPAYTNPQTQKGLVASMPASIIGAVSGGAITATGQTVLNGGIYTATPTIIIQNTGILITAGAALTATMGGQNTTAYIQQM